MQTISASGGFKNKSVKQKFSSLKIFTLVIFSFLFFQTVYSQDKTDYSPKFSGYVRVWYQSDFSTDQGQFLIKQARLSINGSVNEYAGYKFQVDFTRLGKLTTTSTTINGTKVITSASANFSDILLDAAAILTPFNNFEITGGQFKIPYSTDNLRADQNCDFVNRPLLTSVAPLSRDIGITASYKIKGDVNAELIAGSFNGSGFNKTENDKTTDYVFRAVVSPVKDLNLSGNYYGGKSQGAELSYIDFGVDYKIGSLFVDAEYSGKSLNLPENEITGNSYFGFATYEIPLPGNFLKEIIPGFRYESFDPNTSKNNDETSRMTFGLTFEFAKITFAHLRINYEKYNNKDNTINPDKLIIELQTRF